MSKPYIRLDHGQKSYSDYFVINWCFFSICNYSCSYCPTALHDGKVRGLPLEQVKNFCLKVMEAKKDKKIFFEFTGGEMTYYKSFVELFQFLKDQGAETGLISNGGRDLDFWKKHRHLIDHICLSFHPEQAQADHFFEVVKLMNEVATVHVNIMMLPAKFDELHALAKKISSQIEGISISMQALFENMAGKIYEYSSEQKAILDHPVLPWGQDIQFHQPAGKVKKVYRGEMLKVFEDGSVEVANTPEIIAKGENNWLGWQCHIGLENIVIDFHGNVMRGWCGVGGLVGRVDDPAFHFPDKPIQCMTANCYCGLDIMATKVKNVKA